MAEGRALPMGRRAFATSLVAAGMFGAVGVGGKPRATEPDKDITRRAADVVNSFGVATHIDYTDSQYADVRKVIEALHFLGLSRVRDHAPDPASDPVGQSHLHDAAAAGIRFTFVSTGHDPAALVARLRGFVDRSPGSIQAIEGPNEVNNFPIHYRGLTGVTAAQAYQEEMFRLVRADPKLADIPVLAYTNWPPSSAKADWNTLHFYPPEGRQPFFTMLRDKQGQDRIDPGRDFAITEGGYHTLVSAAQVGGWEGVSNAVHARLMVNFYLATAKLGARLVFPYQLLDSYADPGLSDQEKHFGLFDFAFRPKPAAMAVRNLVRILDDRHRDAMTFPVAPLDYRIAGLPPTAHVLPLQKASGQHMIAIWNEPDIWDAAANRPIAAAAVPIMADFGRQAQIARVHRPVAGTVQDMRAGQPIRLPLADEPLLIELG